MKRAASNHLLKNKDKMIPKSLAKKLDKHKHLIDTAKKLIYQQGFSITTLSDISLEADVPLGNIYYYFKEKKDIAAAVLKSIALEQKILFENLDKESDPKTRLHYFLEHTVQERKVIMLQGCRIGTLCQEFAKEGGTLHKLSASIMMDELFWMESQFCALGFLEEASYLSLDLMYKLQGAFLLGYALKDSNLITRQIRLLQAFVQEQVAERINEFEGSTQSKHLEMCHVLNYPIIY